MTIRVLDIEASVRHVGPAGAQRILEQMSFERQRKMQTANIRRLSNELMAGRYIEGSALTMCKLPDGTTILINGHHTLTAIVRTGVSRRLTVIILSVPSMQEVIDIYSTFDLHSSRTWGDALRAAGVEGHVPLAGKILPALGIIGSSFRFGKMDKGNVIHSRQVRISMLEDYAEEAGVMQAALLGAPNQHSKAILRSPVLACALETVRYQRPRAYEFWRGVAQDDCLRKTDPRKALLRYLLSRTLTGGTVAVSDHAKAVARSWNAYYRGDDLSVLRITGGFSLAGTPWGTKNEPEPLPNDLFAEAPTKPKQQPDADVPDILDLFSWGQLADRDGLRTVGFHSPGRA